MSKELKMIKPGRRSLPKLCFLLNVPNFKSPWEISLPILKNGQLKTKYFSSISFPVPWKIFLPYPSMVPFNVLSISESMIIDYAFELLVDTPINISNSNNRRNICNSLPIRPLARSTYYTMVGIHLGIPVC